MAKKSKYTNYDAFSLIKDRITDDKIRFPYICSVVLTGSFDYVQRSGHEFGHVVEDGYKLYAAMSVRDKVNEIFNPLLREEKIGKQIIEATESNMEEFLEKVNETEDHPGLHSLNASEDLYALSIRFGSRIEEQYKDQAFKEIGQRAEQRIINIYRNFNLQIDPDKRTPEKQKLCFRKEYDYLVNTLQDIIEKYI